MKLTKAQKQVLSAINEHRGSTCHEIAELLRKPRRNVGKRLGELSFYRMIEHLRAKRDNETLVVLTESGRAALERE